MRLKANKRMYYGNRSMVAGDEFDASEPHARLLMLARAAAEVLPEMKDTSEDEPKAKRRYKRRDLEAEE